VRADVCISTSCVSGGAGAAGAFWATIGTHGRGTRAAEPRPSFPSFHAPAHSPAPAPAPAPAPPAMDSPCVIDVLCVTESGEVRKEQAVVVTADYDTFLVVGQERLPNAQHATIRDVNGDEHEVVVWDDGSFEDGDEDEDHSHAVYGMLVPRSIFTVDCPVAGNIVVTGLGWNVPSGDTSTESENEE